MFGGDSGIFRKSGSDEHISETEENPENWVVSASIIAQEIDNKTE